MEHSTLAHATNLATRREQAAVKPSVVRCFGCCVCGPLVLPSVRWIPSSVVLCRHIPYLLRNGQTCPSIRTETAGCEVIATVSRVAWRVSLQRTRLGCFCIHTYCFGMCTCTALMSLICIETESTDDQVLIRVFVLLTRHMGPAASLSPYCFCFFCWFL